MDVRHDASAHKFVAPTDNGDAYLAYEVDAHTMDIQHTIVPPEERGHGVADALVVAAVDHAREHRLRVIPSCPFASAWFERHPEQNNVLAGDEDA